MRFKLLFVVFHFLTLFYCCNSGQSNSEIKTNQKQLSVDNPEINWITLKEAEEAVEVEPRGLFVMVYANWCENSKKFEEVTYQDEEVIEKLNTDYYAVKVNAHNPHDIDFKGKVYANPNYDPVRGLDQMNAYHEILYALEAKSVPSTVFLNKDLIVIGSEMGYKNPAKFKSLLEQFQSY